jgi:hypothetical protein
MGEGPYFVTPPLLPPSLSLSPSSPPPLTHEAGRSKERELSFRQQFGSVQSGGYEGFTFLGYLVGSEGVTFCHLAFPLSLFGEKE